MPDATHEGAGFHVNYVFMRFPAATETFARVELRGLRDAGCRVSVSTLRRPKPGAGRLLKEHGLEDLPISYAGTGKWIRGLYGMCRHPRPAWRTICSLIAGVADNPKSAALGMAILPRAFGVALEAKKADVDHVHLFWGHYPSLVGLAMKELDGNCSVSMFLGAYDLVRGFHPSRVLARRVPVTTHARANVPMIARFSGLAPEQIKVIYRGIRVPPAPPRDRAPDDPRILIAERLVPDKRTHDAVCVFGDIVRKYPKVVLIVLGDGPELQRLEKAVADLGLTDRVHFRGRIAHEAVQSEMAASHVLLSMSQSPAERLPNVVKEAMAVGCAIVTTRTPGIDELVVEGESGYVVEPGDIEGAARKISSLLENPGRMRELGRMGRERVVADFDIAVTTRQRLAFWGAELLDQSAN